MTAHEKLLIGRILRLRNTLDKVMEQYEISHETYIEATSLRDYLDICFPVSE